LDHPPNTKIFDSDFRDENDITDLSRRRLATLNRNVPSSTVTINNDFKELATILRGGTPSRAQNTVSNTTVEKPLLPAKINLETFCEHYDLSDNIYYTLGNMKVTGPHSLRFIVNQQLAEAGFVVGEIGDIRDAQERYQKGMPGIENEG